MRDATGAILTMLAAPVQVEAGEVLVPVRATAAPGYRVAFDSFTREVTFRAPGGRAELGAVSADRAVSIQLVPVDARVDGLIVIDRLPADSSRAHEADLVRHRRSG